MKEDSIVFVTHVSYLDGAIEHVKLTSKLYSNFHVVITLSPTQVFRNIIDLRHVDLNDYNTIVDFNEIKDEWKLSLLAPYFENCKSVTFLIYHKSGMGNAVLVTRKFNQHIRSLKPSFIHFDSYMNRQVFQLPFLFFNRKKIILNVHDAKPHSGEEDRVRMFLQRCLYRWCSKFVTFSNFSKLQLEEQISKNKIVVNSFLLPFSFYKNYRKIGTEFKKAPNQISFVGRISKYKGIELFLAAINIVHKKLPELEFVVAGNSFGNYKPDFNKVSNLDKLTAIHKHLSNTELVSIIGDSQLIVCPYLDASQSGVVATALALNRPVLVTEAGGLKEYISEGVNGLICKIDEKDLATKIISFCTNNSFGEMQENMISNQSQNDLKYNRIISEEIY